MPFPNTKGKILVMKKFLQILLLYLSSTTFLFAGSISDITWTSEGSIANIIYYLGDPSYYGRVNCTAFYYDKAIAGGSRTSDGGVANITIKIPKKFRDINKVKFTCVY